MEPNRIIYLDLLRIVATGAMIMLHVAASCMGAVPVDSAQFAVFNFYDSIVRFCVPVFVMISGVLFMNPDWKISVRDLYRVNIRRIAISFIFWSLVYVAYTIVTDVVLDGQPPDGDKAEQLGKDFVYGHYHMWFLYMIIGLYIMTPILRKIAEDRKIEKYFILMSVIFCFGANLLKFLPRFGTGVEEVMSDLNPALVLGFSGYYLAGDYIHRYGIPAPLRCLVYLLGIAGAVFTCVATARMSCAAGAVDSHMYGFLMLNNFLPGVAVFTWVRERFRNREFRPNLTARLVKLSNLTFGIYLVHDLFIMIFMRHGISTLSWNAVISVPLLTLAVFLLSWITAAIIHRIPVLRRTI